MKATVCLRCVRMKSPKGRTALPSPYKRAVLATLCVAFKGNSIHFLVHTLEFISDGYHSRTFARKVFAVLSTLISSVVTVIEKSTFCGKCTGDLKDRQCGF